MGLTFSNIFCKENMRISMVGLDGAGKSTILNKLKRGEVVTTIPTIGFIVESATYKNFNFTVWDLGCQNRIMYKHIVRQYLTNTQGLIFVVDSSDKDRIIEARDELQKMLSEEELRDTVVLIFANKQDLPNAMTAAELTESLQLNKVRKNWYVQPAVGTQGTGLYEGLDWLADNMGKK